MPGKAVATKKQLLVDLKNQLKESNTINLCPADFMDEIKDLTMIAPS